MPLLALDPHNYQIDNKPKESLCGKCNLFKGCLSPRMKPTGKGKRHILIVAEAPGKNEDVQNTQLIGDAGQYLRGILEEVGIDLDEDCIKTNAVRCRPPANRTPTNMEIESCRPALLTLIKEIKPKVIIPLGGTAISSIVSNRVSVGDSSITTWRGFCIPDQDLKAWVCPTFHPAYLIRHTTSSVAELIFKKDLSKAVKYSNMEVPDYSWLSTHCILLKSFSDIKEILEKASNHSDLVAFDYENTGLQPYRSGHSLVSASVGFRNPEPYSYSFLITREIKKLLKYFLISPAKKVIANLSYEKIWSKHLLNVDINNVVYDPILGQHVMDNRSKITGIKFQTYVHLGIPDYSSHISGNLEAPSKLKKQYGSHAMNSIHRIHSDLLGKYNAMDSLVELLLAEKQIKRLGLSI